MHVLSVFGILLWLLESPFRQFRQSIRIMTYFDIQIQMIRWLYQ